MKNSSAVRNDSQRPANPDFEELSRRCKTCSVSNPLICREICELWILKSAKPTSTVVNSERPILSVLNTLDPQSLKALQTLSSRPKVVNNADADLGVPRHHISDLLQAGLIAMEQGLYKVTLYGKKVLEVLSQYPEGFKECTGLYDQQVLLLLLEGKNSFESLLDVIPEKILATTLRRLQTRELVYRASSKRDVLYFATKRRPTRHLLPMEMKIFKSLPREGITAKELSKKLGLTKPSIYRYLRRLRYRRHVARQRQGLTFGLTPKGRQVAQFLETVLKLEGSLSPTVSVTKNTVA
ncbi:MAG: hypothetical protein QXI32_03785 [Candidatus Bathyarchaeia archaeon]